MLLIQRVLASPGREHLRWARAAGRVPSSDKRLNYDAIALVGATTKSLTGLVTAIRVSHDGRIPLPLALRGLPHVVRGVHIPLREVTYRDAAVDRDEWQLAVNRRKHHGRV